MYLKFNVPTKIFKPTGFYFGTFKTNFIFLDIGERPTMLLIY